MGLGFSSIPERTGYLRQAGLQQAATFVGLTYNATEDYEYFDIEFECADGKMFRERTFGANPEKVFPRTKWENGKQVGTETKGEAYDRTQEEISKKLFELASCFATRTVLKERVSSARDLRELVAKVNSVIGDPTALPRVNFLTIWKNSDTKKKSNLILADKTKWCEATQFDASGRPMPASIKLTTYQLNNNVVEKYPYNSNAEAVATDSPAVGEAPTDLPF